MSWNYVSAPQDGTLWLEWISARSGEHRFPSDGYVWGDMEQTYRQEFGGYTLEMLVHNVGYRPQYENMAAHARTRYHFIAKNPSVNAAPPDPNLWIVHYHQADQGRVLPSQQVPLSNPMRQIMSERRWLESQGKIERRDFMLHDREHWPTIHIPGNAQMQQQTAMMQQQQHRFPQSGPYQQQGGPPAKRARTGTSTMPGPPDGVHDTSIEDEENTSLGDFFDHLSPREISMARYMQHHRWMEEVFSSPYASSHIVPPDLGLGLMGELKGLTDGILNPPSVDDVGRPAETSNKAQDAQPFTNLRRDQVDEFNKRVEKHLEEGQAEIERMKKEHAEKMAEWKKTKTLMQAEKKLRHATWEGHESAVSLYRMDVPATNGHAEEHTSPDTVEDVVREVESLLGVKIEGHRDATMIEKGGLEKSEEEPKEDVTPQGNVNQNSEMAGMNQDQSMTSGANGEPSRQAFNSQPEPVAQTKAEALAPTVPANVSQPTLEAEQEGQQQVEASTEDQPPISASMDDETALDDMDGMEVGDTSLMDGMDMDVDTGDIDFVQDEDTPGERVALSGVSDAPAVQAIARDDLDPAQASNVASPVTLGQIGDQQAQASELEQQSLPTGTAEESLTNQPGIDTSDLPVNPVGGDLTNAEQAGDNSMFDDGTFDDLNMEGEPGDDGLIDFDGGMGMEDSAFGDALHGMDTPAAGQEGEDAEGS